MSKQPKLVEVLDAIVCNPSNRWWLAAVKGWLHGIAEGVKIRAPHALIMTFLFGNGTTVQKLLTIFKLTKTHSLSVAWFVFCYKLGIGAMGLTNRLKQQQQPWLCAISAGVSALLVFNMKNPVHAQIIMYSFSRAVIGLFHLWFGKNSRTMSVLSNLLGSVPLFWLFAAHPQFLSRSINQSMTRLYHNSNQWTNIMEFLFRF